MKNKYLCIDAESVGCYKILLFAVTSCVMLSACSKKKVLSAFEMVGSQQQVEIAARNEREALRLVGEMREANEEIRSIISNLHRNKVKAEESQARCKDKAQALGVISQN